MSFLLHYCYSLWHAPQLQVIEVNKLMGELAEVFNVEVWCICLNKDIFKPRSLTVVYLYMSVCISYVLSYRFIGYPIDVRVALR